MNQLAEKLPKAINIQQLNSRLSVWINILLILACSYSLSQITWLLIPADESPGSAPVSIKNNTRHRAVNKQPEYAQIISQAHLFGRYQQKGAPEAVNTDAPETRLNLVLKGLLAATPMEHASAIIAIGKRGKEDIYGIGDKISGATIREIHTDRVVLERNGRYETLRMPKDFTGSTLIRSNPASGVRVSASDSPGRILSNIRKNILKNPTSFGQYAIPVPYKVNGRLKGYRLQPQGDNSLFDAVGLEPNDVITRVNGIGLNKPSNGLSALRKLQNAKQVNLTVIRNGAEIPLSIEIP